jgi:hypothetical protein
MHRFVKRGFEKNQRAQISGQGGASPRPRYPVSGVAQEIRPFSANPEKNACAAAADTL